METHVFKRLCTKRIVLRNVIEVDEGKPLFQLFFLKDDENQDVEVKEVKEIDFAEIEKRLKDGESVFITRKRKQKLNTRLVAEEDAAEHWYFSHV